VLPWHTVQFLGHGTPVFRLRLPNPLTLPQHIDPP
jgi:hypothetical protein